MQQRQADAVIVWGCPPICTFSIVSFMVQDAILAMICLMIGAAGALSR